MAEIFQSDFVFGLQGKRYQDFLDIVAMPIIEKIIDTKNYEFVDFEKHLSFKDFKDTPNIVTAIYTNFLYDIVKNDTGVSFKKKVCITLDKRLCNETCPTTGRKIATIKVADVEMAYFIYFNVKEFFDFVYDEKSIEKPDVGYKLSIDDNINPSFNKDDFFVDLGFSSYSDFKAALRSSKKLVTLLERMGVTVPCKQGKNELIPAVSKYDEEFRDLLNQYDNPLIRKVIQEKLSLGDNSDPLTSALLPSDKPIVSKVGYIHNHNDRFSFIRTSIGGDGFPIPHNVYPEIANIKIGTAIKALCEYDESTKKIAKTISYEVCSKDELDIKFEIFEGEIERLLSNNFAFIKNDENRIYVPFSLAKDFEENKVYKVRCLTVQSYDKHGNLSWEAIDVWRV